MPKAKTTKALFLEKLAKMDSQGKFFLFIVMFTALGGCYFVYKSFAEQFLK